MDRRSMCVCVCVCVCVCMRVPVRMCVRVKCEYMYANVSAHDCERVAYHTPDRASTWPVVSDAVEGCACGISRDL
jgi:hypothetical protein